jgi:hypothetical protein
MYKASIRAQRDQGYQVEWKSSNPISSFSCKIEEINFYDEASGSDIIVPVEEEKIKYEIINIGKNNYEVCFVGGIVFDLTQSQLKKIKNRNFSVDYLMVFFDKDDNQAESDEDYELIQNVNVILEDILKE